MERPSSTESEAIRNDALLDQYIGTNVKSGYLEDDTLINKQSRAPTLPALTLWI